MKMTKCLIIGVVLSLISTVAVVGEEGAPAKTVVLAPIGEVDAAMVTRVAAFVESTTRIPVKIRPAQEATGGLEEGARSVKMDEETLVTVAFVNPAEATEAHGISFPEDRLAAINVVSLRPKSGDKEVYGRRLERQTIRSLSILLGMQPCPNPHCALSPYKTDEELDRMGRGLCPPCMDKVRKAAAEAGAQLNTPPTPPPMQ